MTTEELHQLHLNKLVNSFGVANAIGAFWNDRAARALGNHYSETSDPGTDREEI